MVAPSLSARRAWIEIIDYIIDYATDAVALRKESVDRNVILPKQLDRAPVALRKESVDRNARKIRPVAPDISSLSARRAWIEIFGGVFARPLVAVALRKESVDRNGR